MAFCDSAARASEVEEVTRAVCCEGGGFMARRKVSVLRLDHRVMCCDATRRKVHLHMHVDWRRNTRNFECSDHGNLKTPRTALGGARKPNSFILACFWHPPPSHQSPPGRAYTCPACAEACRQIHGPASITATSHAKTACLPHIHQEAQSHPHSFRTIRISGVRGEALRLRMARRGSGREGAGGSGQELEEMRRSGHSGRRARDAQEHPQDA